MQLAQLNISSGGMPKHAVLMARVTVNGVEGDRQRNRIVHGGPARAVCIFSEELYAELQAEGINVHPGDLGENFTTRGIDLRTLAPGDCLVIGECSIRLTKVRAPCTQLNKWHPNLNKLIEGRSGWVARVLREGMVKPGDSIRVVKRDDVNAENVPGG